MMGNRVYKEWPTNSGNHKGLRALLLVEMMLVQGSKCDSRTKNTLGCKW